MKVLPMHEPWASLVCAGWKKVETRPRPCPHSMKGRVAIHANKTEEFLHLKEQLPFSNYSYREGTLGHIIGTVEILRTVTITEEVAAWQRDNKPDEFALGDYTPGRFGWVLARPVELDEPIPFRAHQGYPDIPIAQIPRYAQ